MSDSVQKFVSRYLTHFVGRKFADPGSKDYVKDVSDREAQQYSVLKAVLDSGYLADHVGAAPGILGYHVGMKNPLCGNEMVSVSAVCFCDIPLDDLGLHMGKYGEFGLCFEKRFLVDRGASPVFYVATNAFVRERDSGDGAIQRQTRGEYFNEIGALYGPLHSFMWTRKSTPVGLEDPDLLQVLKDCPSVREHPSWERLCHRLDDLIHFFDAYVLGFVKCFDDGLPDADERNFYMEREWRAVTRVDFTLADVASVIVPRSYEERLREEFPDLRPEKVRAAEMCKSVGPAM